VVGGINRFWNHRFGGGGDSFFFGRIMGKWKARMKIPLKGGKNRDKVAIFFRLRFGAGEEIEWAEVSV
jgi:hypothetical protein